MKVVIAGGSGALGRRLADDFAGRGWDVAILTRSRSDSIGHRQVEWDGRSVGPWMNELEGAVLINLAGKLVDVRPTKQNIELLTRSRVEPTRALVEASNLLATPPILWIQMSTLALFGDAGEQVINEGSPPASSPPQMAGVAQAWEGALSGAKAGRLVVLRTSLVFDKGTPIFDRLSLLTKLGLGGRIGSGAQWVSWIHIEDFLRVVRLITEDQQLDGLFHVTAPNPVRNRDVMATLRSALKRPASPPAPDPLVRLGAWLMGSDPALALTGRRCIPRRLLNLGFHFEYETFDEAFRNLVGSARP